MFAAGETSIGAEGDKLSGKRTAAQINSLERACHQATEGAILVRQPGESLR